ncbi:hypothetical protein BD311DRAFT_763127 [Dichomitus squalens]|uniref:Uncharacterized protein n=1 Tax=Dichomitus squalens TaxID=114155 RepID=A0A4Q9MFF4_9APHY|nr:hypothetical protein BD311DRAFT_763127 [Dichomitus squalens]
MAVLAVIRATCVKLIGDPPPPWPGLISRPPQRTNSVCIKGGTGLPARAFLS